MLIVLNDNEMSISPTVGAISQYLSRIKLSRTWRGSKRAVRRHRHARCRSSARRCWSWSRPLPQVDRQLRASRASCSRTWASPTSGPVPGHSLRQLERTSARALRDMDGPVIVHVRTRKGRGYRPAEADKVSFHGAALPPMTVLEGGDGNTVGPAQEEGDAALSSSRAQGSSKKKPPNYTSGAVRGADPHRRRRRARRGDHGRHAHRHRPGPVPAVLPDADVSTWASPSSTPSRWRPASRSAASGPFVAIYSTFLQRAFDQLVHDVCQNDVPVVIGVDRAGLVGEDGTSHQGMFALAGAAPAAEPGHRLAQGRAGAAPPAAHGVRPGPPVRAPLPARPGLRPARGRADADPGRPGRGAARGHATS